MKQTITKVILFVGCVLLQYLTTQAQNLVPNPSFEDAVCPGQGMGFEEFIFNWKAARETPDYYNSCSAGWSSSVPANYEGYQQAATGNAYIGMLTYVVPNTLTPAEVASVQLLSPLTVGQKYYVSFKLSWTLFDGNVGMANNKIGIQFSSIEYNQTNPMPYNNQCHLCTDTIITDSVNWTVVSGIFIADASYSHLNLGSFFENQYIDAVGYGDNYAGAYYYFDDVSVIAIDSTLHSFVMPSAFSPNQDNINDTYYPVFYDSTIVIREFRIYNRWGQLLYNNPKEGWNGTYNSQLEPVDDYTYYIYIDLPDPDNPSRYISQKKEGSFTLLR